MNLTEKWPVLRLPALGRAGPVDDERLLRLFWNRAELKKALQGLDDELHALRDRIKQQDGAHSRLEEELDRLETLLGTPERGPDALVHFGLRNLWRECRRQLEGFAAELRRQRQDHERKRQLAEFQHDRQERLKLADERLAEARSVVELEEDRLAEGQKRLSSMTALWQYFRRRDLEFELDAQRSRVAEARRHLEDMLQSRRTIEKEPWPEFTGLSIQGRRGINLAVIAYAQLLCQRLAPHGLAVQARLAAHRRVEDGRFGTRADCLARLDQLAEAMGTVRSQDGVAAEIRVLTDRLKRDASWRGPEDVVPAPSSVQSVAAEGPNVLIDDYWDLYRVLLR